MENKSLAYQILYSAVKKIQQKTETNPLLILRHRSAPQIKVDGAADPAMSSVSDSGRRHVNPLPRHHA